MLRKLYTLKLGLFLLSALLVNGGARSSIAASQSEAYAGEPFGVGRVTVDVLRGQAVLPLSDERFTLMENSGRVMYPVLKEETARRLLRQLLDIETPRQVTIYYLFQGNEPFDLSVFAPNEQGLHVQPLQDEAAHSRLLDEWWQQLTRRQNRLQKDPAYPPIAENFVTATMARRLHRSLPEPKGGFLPWNKKKDSVLSELFLGEGYQLRVDQQMLIDDPALAPPLAPLPQPIHWTEADISEKQLEGVAVEPLALHVPAECFYLRFGNFGNYFWFRELNQKWQGDLGNMIFRRGILKQSGKRVQQQLSLRENALAKILGPQVISDAALIGFDPYITQGAAIGILFQAKNNFLVSQDMMNQRRASLQKFPDAEETTVKIAGHDVSLVATPDGRVRSYYVQQDDFHLVTTSAKLVERFIEAGQGERSLGTLPTFLQARKQLPLERGDAIFAFLSEKFFQNLCSPQYRVETVRRLRSFRQRHLLELARFAAGVERSAAVSPEELIEADLLPTGFGMRVDNSQLVEGKEGYLDNVRGAPGFFLPVADVDVPFASPAELAEYESFARRFQQEVGQLPPLAVGVQRVSNEETAGETMCMDVWATQLASTKLAALTDALGEPAEQQLRPIEGDVLAAEAVLDIPVPLVGGESQPHHLFGALRDFRSPLVVRGGAVLPGAMPAELVRGYLGAWPRPGILEMLLGSARPNGNLPERAGDQLWQAQQDEFLLISFKPDVVEQVLPQLAFEPAQRPAQVRMRLKDLTGTLMAENVSALGYMRSRETSVAASRLMNSLANQLQVPRPDCREVAQRLVDGRFTCALGGEYQLYAPERGLEVWLSSALPEENRFLLTEVPPDFELPLLTWFRGLQGDLEVTEQELRVHLEIEMTPAALP
ncbi:MAG: hypothetical protein MI725_14335 [Pirellulales bacterium]|nr:hypothetical protein [Pirellulales bacterium]